jgi:hypothetical protein
MASEEKLKELQERLDALQAPAAPGGGAEIEALQARLDAASSSVDPTRAPEPWYEDLAEGVGASALSTYYGLKDLTVGLGEGDRERLEDWEADAAQSGWGTGGRIAGEIGQLLIPGAGVLKGVQGLNLAKNASRAAMLGGDVALAAAYGASQLPGEGESRSRRAFDEASGALVGAGLFKAAKGLTPTDAARRMYDRGVRLTPGQASANPFVKGLEEAGSVTPLVAQGVNRSRKAAISDVNEAMFREAAPPGATITKTGPAGVLQLKDAFNKAYSDAWEGATGLSNEARTDIVNIASRSVPRLAKKQRTALKNVMADFKDLTRGATAESLKAFDNELRKRIATTSKKDIDFTEVLQNMRTALREGMPNEVAEKLAAVDAKYGDYLVVRRAVKNSLQEEARQVPPSVLINSVKAEGGNRAGEGTAPLYGLAADVADTAGQKQPGAPLEWFRRLAGITYTPLPMQLGGRIAMGRTGVQQGMSRDSSGNYTLPLPDVVAGTIIEDTWANTSLNDIAAALTDSLSRSGNGGMSEPLPFVSGSIGAPGITWADEPTMGFYRKQPGGGDMRASIGGADITRWNNGVFSVWANAMWNAVVYAGGPGTVPAGTVEGQTLSWDNAGTGHRHCA